MPLLLPLLVAGADVRAGAGVARNGDNMKTAATAPVLESSERGE